MLEFIVLGIVPGTRFNITFSWVLAAAAVFLIVLEIRYHKNYALKVQALTASTETVVKSQPKRRSPTPTTTKKKTTAPKRKVASTKSTTGSKSTKASKKTKRSTSRSQA